MRAVHQRKEASMPKSEIREPTPVRRRREQDAELGGAVDLELCGKRKVGLRSDLTATALRRVGAAYVRIDGEQVVIKQLARLIAVVTTDAAALRRCLEAGVRFEADLAHVTDRADLEVVVRPLRPR